MNKGPQTEIESDDAAFEKYEKLDERHRKRERFRSNAEQLGFKAPWQQRVERWFYIIFLSLLVTWGVLASWYTPIRFSPIIPSFGPEQSGTYGEILYPVLFLVALCLGQLVICAGRGVGALGRRSGLPLFRLRLVVEFAARALIFAALGSFVSLCMYLMSKDIVYSLNVHLDRSQPSKISTDLIDRVPNTYLNWRVPARLRLVDWRLPGGTEEVTVIGYPSVFDIQGKTVTFYVRDGALGWPYAIQRSVVDVLNSSQP